MSAENTEFASSQVNAVGPHALLGELITHMSAIEAHLLVMTVASHLPSTVPQNILRDVMNRYRLKQQGAAA
jgi:hypothetical protein